MTGQQISTAEDLDALPVNSYWQCRCEYHGMKGGRDRYVLSTGRILTAEQMVEDHLPLTVLYRPDAPVAPSDDSAVDVLREHTGWAENGPDDDGSWRVVCFDCGADLGGADEAIHSWQALTGHDNHSEWVKRGAHPANDMLIAQHQVDMLREAGLLAVAPKARIEALCRLLESEGHMTPVATMQIVKLWEVP